MSGTSDSERHADGPFLVGLTGGIASGKSTVADMFAELGVAVIDTDVIARELVEPGQPALARVREAFGPDVIADNGSLDRPALRNRVFANGEDRRRLEDILHPRIRESAMEQARIASGPYRVVVVPLLAESPMRHAMSRVLAVDVPESLQLERLLARDAESEEQARRMIAAQASREDRLAIADDVVDNGGDLAATRRQVAALHERYLALAGRSRP